MSSEILDSVTDVYSTSSECKVVLHTTVSNPMMEEFRSAAKGAIRVMPGPETTIWRVFARELRQLSFTLHHAVLPTCHRTYESLLAAQRFDEALRELDKTERVVTSALIRLREARTALAEEYFSPYRDLLRDIVLEQDPNSAIVVVEPYWIHDITVHLVSSVRVNTLTVVSSKDRSLKGLDTFSRLYVIGSIASHPECLYTASRALQTHWLLYPWMKRALTPRISLKLQGINQWWQVSVAPSNPTVELPGNSVEGSDTVEDESEWTPPPDYWNAVGSADTANDATSFYDLIEAKMLAVTGDRVVLVPLEERVDCIDIATLSVDPSRARLSRRGKDVQPGDYLVVYSRGSREHIKAEADRLLGANANRYRSMQILWKDRLRQAVKETSVDHVSQCLRLFGAVSAEAHHVRYWISEFFIRPNDKRDFEAIMDAIGLQPSTTEYWNVLCSIITHHQQAGKQLKRALRQQLQSIDCSALVSTGRFDFLGGDDTGNLTVVYVERVIADCTSVPKSQLLKLLE